MKIVKITAIVCTLILFAIPATGAIKSKPNSYEHNFCSGKVFGEIEDYKLSRIAQLIFWLKGEPSTILITRATIIIRQNPDRRALELIDPIKQICMAYYGNITIHFYASIVKINFNPDENCSVPICSGIFGRIYIEET